MKATKTFDCVAMKNAVQAKLRKEMAGMTDEEQRAYIRRKLQTSDSPVARLWRELNARKAEQEAERPKSPVPPRRRGRKMTVSS
jgi:sRNA-binding protein